MAKHDVGASISLGPATLRPVKHWDPVGPNDIQPGEFVRVGPFTADGGYHADGGIATAYRGVEIFLEGRRSPAMASRLLHFERHIDGALPTARHQLAHLNLFARPNPDDAVWAKTYRMPDFTSLATSGDGHSNFWDGLSGQQQDLDHELGHVITTSGSAPRAAAWTRAMELDRRNLAAELGRGIIQPASRRIPMLAGADQHGISTYGNQALVSAGSQAEDWAESLGWYNRSRRTGWVAKVAPQAPSRAQMRRVDFADLFPHRAGLIDTYLAGLDASRARS